MNDQTRTSDKQDNNEINLLELFQTILHGKWRILFYSVLFTSFAFIYSFGKTPVYKADALLQVESQKAAIPGLEDLASIGGGDDTSVGTELEIIKSRKIIGQAVEFLKLDITAQPKKIPLLSNLHKRFFSLNEFKKPPQVWTKIDRFIQQYAWGNESIIVNKLVVPDSLLNQALTLTNNGNGEFDISFKDRILLKGKINQLSSSENNEIKVNIRSLEGTSGTKYTIKKWSALRAINNLQKKIKASEKGKKTGVINLILEGSDKQIIVNTLDHISKTYLDQNKSRSAEEASSALKFLKEQIKPVKEESETAEVKLKEYRTNNQTADMSMETQAVLDVVSGIDTEIQKLSLKREELAQKYTPNHPIIQAINSQEKKLISRKNKALKKISKLPETQQELLKLERNYKVANSVYIDLVNKIQEFKIAKASSVGNVYIIDTAVVHDKSVRPKKQMVLALGSLLGATLGLLLVFLRKALHKTISNPEVLEEVTNIAVYATVPLTKGVNLTGGIKKNKRQKSLLAIDKATDPAVESLRSLRTSLHFALLEAKNNIVMITGPSPGIGKSFISSNFAAVIAAGEQRVLLIDADMRKGYLHNLLNKKVSPGLSDLIGEKTTLDEAINTIQVGENSLDIITRGQTPPNPSELLMHSNFERLLNQLSNKYDLILIDTPPVHAVTDPSIIGKLSGVVFMVVRSEQHSMKEIEHAVSRLAQNGIETKGFIFNGYNYKKSTYGYDGYGYQSYYGEYKSD